MLSNRKIKKEFAMSPLHRVCSLKASKASPKTASGFSLIEMLVVIALIAVLGGSLFSFYAGKGSGKKGEAKTPMTAAHDSECLQNLGSVRQCIKAEEATDDEKHPTALTAIKSLTPELRACPVGKEPYAYDPVTGEIHCIHPGHEKY
jgi:prepilin-type N-terminal cleavage/methylation domain-containing protein